MAIKKRENKFDGAVAELDEHESIAREKSEKVVKNIAGKGVKTKTIVDKAAYDEVIYTCSCGATK